MPPRPRRAEATAATLRAEIAAGRYRPGERLPAEPDLAGQLGVSRPTLREAFRLLHEEGLVRREHGSGTYVRERPALRNNLERNFGVTSLIESFGLEPGIAERSVGEEPANEEIAAALGVEPGTLLLAVDQVDYTARDEPVLHSREHHLADAFAWSVYRRGPGEDET